MESPNPRRRRRSHRDGKPKSPKGKPETLSARLNRITGTVIAILIALGIMAGAFFFGRSTVRVPAVRKSAASPGVDGLSGGPRVPAGRMPLFDRVFALMSAGKLQEAREFLAAALQKEPDLPFGRFLLGRICFLANEPLSGLPLLRQSIEAGEAVAPSLRELARATRVAPRGDSESIQLLQEAMQADPISADAFFDYGEAMRAKGRFGEAVAHLQGALDRSFTTSERPVVETKLAFARIEAEDESIEEELQAAAAANPPKGNLLVAAAALALQTKNYPQAAQLLTQARATLPSEIFRFLIADQIFALSRGQPELQPFFAAVRSEPAQ